MKAICVSNQATRDQPCSISVTLLSPGPWQVWDEPWHPWFQRLPICFTYWVAWITSFSLVTISLLETLVLTLITGYLKGSLGEFSVY